MLSTSHRTRVPVRRSWLRAASLRTSAGEAASSSGRMSPPEMLRMSPSASASALLMRS
jgi:hypothetical protein